MSGRRFLSVIVLIALTITSGLFSGCRKKTATLTLPDEFEQLRFQADALQARLGPDALREPEMDEIIKRLEAIPANAQGYNAAQILAMQLKRDRRYALSAMADLRDESASNPPEPFYGIKKMAGAPPEQSPERAAAEAIKVGASREALIRAYGSCLVRQSWFPGRNGGPTIELFQVSPECREKLKSRVFRVLFDRITQIDLGNVDYLLTSSHSRGHGAGSLE